MLKIRDKIDLKELEKFGFKQIRGSYKLVSKKSIMPSEKCYIKEHYCMTVFNKNRKILFGGVARDNVQDILFDLIKNGLVEKVVNK